MTATTVKLAALVTALMMSSGRSFTPLQCIKKSNCRPRTTATVRFLSESSKEEGSDNDEVARIRNEFKELHNELDSTAAAASVAPEEIAEDMLKSAADLAAYQKKKQADLLEEAEEDFKHAHGDLEEIQSIKEQAHQDAENAERQAKLMEAWEGEYEDRERMRENSIAHALHQVEHDAHDLEVELQFRELEAQAKYEDANKLYEQFRNHEMELKSTLKELEDYKRDKAMHKWTDEKERARQEELLRAAQKHVTSYRTTVTVFQQYQQPMNKAKQQQKQQQQKQSLKTSQKVVIPQEVAEEILEEALHVTEDQKHKQQNKLEEAQAEYRHAHEELEDAVTMLRKAKHDERARDLYDAAHELEMNAKELQVEAQFHELQAEMKADQAEALLRKFEQHELELKSTLQEIQSFQTSTADVIKTVKDKLHERSQEG